MRQANQLPIFIDMIREFRSSEFQLSEQYVLYKLRSENSNPGTGISGLPDEARIAAFAVQSFFGVLANLVVDGIVTEASAVATLGYRANRLWTEMEPFIAGERRLRGDADFAMFFEDFICRVRASWPPEDYYRLKIRRVPAS